MSIDIGEADHVPVYDCARCDPRNRDGERRFCPAHRCESLTRARQARCRNSRVPGSRYCTSHKCHHPGCTEAGSRGGYCPACARERRAVLAALDLRLAASRIGKRRVALELQDALASGRATLRYDPDGRQDQNDGEWVIQLTSGVAYRADIRPPYLISATQPGRGLAG